jgi:hypothetical protein
VSIDRYSLVVCCLGARTLGTGETFIDPCLDALMLMLMLLTAADVSSGRFGREKFMGFNMLLQWSTGSRDRNAAKRKDKIIKYIEHDAFKRSLSSTNVLVLSI